MNMLFIYVEARKSWYSSGSRIDNGKTFLLIGRKHLVETIKTVTLKRT